VVSVVFSVNVSGQPGKNDLGAREPDNPNHLFQRFAVSNRFEGMKHVLGGRIGGAKKPDIGDSVRGKRAARLHLSFIVMAPCRLTPFSVPKGAHKSIRTSYD
jgi:hypothetical protein